MRVLTILDEKVVAAGQYDVLPEPVGAEKYLVSEYDGQVGNLMKLNDAGDVVFVEDLGEKHTPAPMAPPPPPETTRASIPPVASPVKPGVATPHGKEPDHKK